MQNEPFHIKEIQKDAKNISRYTGLYTARIILLICLFFLLPFLAPTLYIFIYVGAFPWILESFFLKKYTSGEVILKFSAKKYRYTPIRYAAEKYAAGFIILFLAVWQIFVGHEALHYAPGLLLLLYLLVRFFTTRVIRHKIHLSYTELTILEE